MPPPTVKLLVRLPPETHAALRAAADRDRRSLNAKIVTILDDVLGVTPRPRPARKAPTPKEGT